MICPHCKERIIRVDFKAFGEYDGRDYDYEESATVYSCPKCENEIDADEVEL